ncbi:MAG: hypothetical protein V2I35_10660 [Desulfocapsaceae bacterium]|nr:hypothetical protein [Desulfocapsaceae bacterium]
MGRFLLEHFRPKMLLILLATLCFVKAACSGELEENTLLENVVNIDCYNESIDTVLIDISRQSGLEITYDPELEEKPILFSFQDRIRAIDAVVRLLRGRNNVIEYSTDRKNLNIRLFDI